MFYRPGQDEHGLPHNPYKAIVAPRPIGWVSSQDAEGRANLAPYSFFNGVADDPPMVMYSTTGTKPGGEVKDSLENIRATNAFAVNVVSRALFDAMNTSSAHVAPDVDEFAAAGLDIARCETIDAPRVASAPAALECTLWKVLELPARDTFVVIGTVTGIHIDDAMLRDGILDVTRYQPVARLGYKDYAAVTEVFSVNRPGQA